MLVSGKLLQIANLPKSERLWICDEICFATFTSCIAPTSLWTSPAGRPACDHPWQATTELFPTALFIKVCFRTLSNTFECLVNIVVSSCFVFEANGAAARCEPLWNQRPTSALSTFSGLFLSAAIGDHRRTKCSRFAFVSQDKPGARA